MRVTVRPTELRAAAARGIGVRALIGDQFQGAHVALSCFGYYLIEARDLDEAMGIAERIPVARVGTIEIRPVLEIPGLPEK